MEEKINLTGDDLIAALDNLTPVQRIAKQIQEKDTPSKKQARDKNLLREAFKEAQIQHGKRLYPYKLNFVEFFKDVSYILKAPKVGPGRGQFGNLNDTRDQK